MKKSQIIMFFLMLGMVCASASSRESLNARGLGGDSAVVRLTNVINRFNRVFPQEKVYLHFDNTGYFMGETIWFKAYVQTTDKAGLGSRSSVLYVELIDPSGSVFTTKKLKIENGEAHGEIQLNNLALSGFYQVRAYTRYMLNWGRNAVFSRTFPIFKAPKTKGDYGDMVLEQDIADAALPDKTLADDAGNDSLHNSINVSGTFGSDGEKSVNVRFYPEGGNLVEGLESSVAFECFDREGKPLEAEGWLVQDGIYIYKVKTQREGRGRFNFTPGKGEAKVELTFANGKTRSFDMPSAVKSGVVMAVDASADDSIRWKISMTDDMRNVLMGQVFMHNGQMFHCNVLDGKTVVGAYACKDMPAGVDQIALTDMAGNIYSDRLVFVFPRQDDFAETRVMAADSLIWPKKSVKINVDTAPNASFSVSVCDAETQTGGCSHNAATWYLLTSDLKGYINHPEYYLEADDREHRQAADLLMMVQGWRRYNVKMMEGKETFVKKYPIEDRLYIDGQLKARKKRNTVDNVDLTMVLVNKQGDQLVGKTETDRKGNYAFAVPDCWHDWNLLMMTRKGDRDLNYYIGINRHFSPSVKP